jgi:hypothetical protein
MPRGNLHTALGGTQLGMAVPLAALSAVLVFFGGAAIGVPDGPPLVPIAALALLSAALLATSGAMLLWEHQLVPAPRATPVRPSASPRVRSRRPSAASPRRLPHPVMLAGPDGPDTLRPRPRARHAR